MRLALAYFRKLLALCIILLSGSQQVLAAPVSLTLDECVALAFKNNPEYKITAAEYENAYWAVKQAKANKRPTLDYTYTGLKYGDPPSSSYRWTTKYDNTLMLSLPLYSGGKLESQVDQAELNRQIAALDVEATKQQLKLTVTTYYFNVLQYRRELEVSRETVADYEAHVRNVQLQHEAGTVARSDVLASEVALANAQNNLIKTQNNYDLAVAQLNNAIGLPLDSELALQDNIDHEKVVMTLDDCSRYALSHRPEAAQYQAKIASAQADIKIAHSGYQPTVSLVASQEWYDNDFPGLNNGNWYIGLTGSFSIFDSGINKAKVQQAQAGLAAAQEAARQTRDSILVEVRQAYLNMREAEKRIETSRVAVAEAEENLKIAEIRYAAGVGTNLDVLDAILSLNKAKLNYIQAYYDYNVNKAQLAKAMGMAVE